MYPLPRCFFSGKSVFIKVLLLKLWGIYSTSSYCTCGCLHLLDTSQRLRGDTNVTFSSLGCLISAAVTEAGSTSLPCSPLYYGLCGPGPSGLCEVTAHATCSDQVSPWLLGSFSGHARGGRCIDLAVQMPSDTHKRKADTHLKSHGTHRAFAGMLALNLHHLYTQARNRFTGFCAILCLMRLTVRAPLI